MGFRFLSPRAGLYFKMIARLDEAVRPPGVEDESSWAVLPGQLLLKRYCCTFLV